MELKKATRKQVKLRMGLSGVSGSGKTYSALLLAYGITNDWGKIAVIDTENSSASLYSNLGEFLTIDLQAPYSPERYIEAIKTCENAGIEVIVIDSITHEWEGKGGCLEISEQITQASSSKNSYTSWAKVTPRHQAFIDAILQSKCHVITTVRRKQDYEMSKNQHGKTVVEKAGLKEITREGFEYELTLNLQLSLNHLALASKDRTGLFMDKAEFVINSETGKTILAWCNEGKDEQKELLTQYLILLTDTSHVFSTIEQDTYSKGAENWSADKLKKAITKIEALISERENQLLEEEQEKIKNQQIS